MNLEDWIKLQLCLVHLFVFCRDTKLKCKISGKKLLNNSSLHISIIHGNFMQSVNRRKEKGKRVTNSWLALKWYLLKFKACMDKWTNIFSSSTSNEGSARNSYTCLWFFFLRLIFSITTLSPRGMSLLHSATISREKYRKHFPSSEEKSY